VLQGPTARTCHLPITGPLSGSDLVSVTGMVPNPTFVNAAKRVLSGVSTSFRVLQPKPPLSKA
jgi:hypothetical protein